MSLEDNASTPVIQLTNSMIANNEISIEVATKLMAHINLGLSEAVFILKGEIAEKIHSWDSLYGDKDKTLYTLGLRHALDIIDGKLATDNNGFNGKPYVSDQEFKLEDPL